MKLKLTALFLTTVLIVSLFSGCSNSAVTAGEETTGAEDSAAISLTASDYDDYDLTEYITLGQYKAVEIAKQDTAVTDEQYNEYIASVLSDNTTTAEVTDRAAQTGDTLNIDYVGTMNDMDTPDGMTATGQSLVLGSGSYITGFEEGLAGANKGDVVTLNLTFPDPYTNNADLAGQAVTFVVTVNSITNTITPELTDEFVATISDYATVDEYKSSVMLDLASQNAETALSTQKNDLWTAVVDNSTIIKYPDTVIQAYTDDMVTYYTDYATSNGYETLEAFLTDYYGTTLADFNTEAATYAQNAVAEDMVLYSIVKAENLYLTQEEYDAGAANYVTMYEYESAEALETEYGKDVIIKSVLWDKIMDFLLEQAVEVETTAETAAETAAAE